MVVSAVLPREHTGQHMFKKLASSEGFDVKLHSQLRKVVGGSADGTEQGS